MCVQEIAGEFVNNPTRVFAGEGTVLTFGSGDNYLLRYIHCLLYVIRPRSNNPWRAFPERVRFLGSRVGRVRIRGAPSKNVSVSLARESAVFESVARLLRPCSFP